MLTGWHYFGMFNLQSDVNKKIAVNNFSNLNKKIVVSFPTIFFSKTAILFSYF